MSLSPAIVYGLPSEELIGVASLSLTDGALDTGYDLSALFDGDPGGGCRFTTDHLALVIDHGSAVTCQFPQLTHTNLRSTATALFERNATNSWGSPSVSVAFTLTDADRAGLRKNPWIDRSADAVAYRYSRLVITGNGTPIIIGQLPWYSTLHQLARNIPDKPVLLPATDTVILPTNFKRELVTQRAVRQWSLKTSGGFQDATSHQQLLDWFDDCAGPASGFGMVFDPSKNDAWFARFGDDTVAQHARLGPAGAVTDMHWSWLEKSRGQVWP